MTTVDEVRQFILDADYYPALYDIYNEFGNSTSTAVAVHVLQIKNEIIFVPHDDGGAEVILYVKASAKMQEMMDKGELIKLA